jgi:hypothetical protein
LLAFVMSDDALSELSDYDDDEWDQIDDVYDGGDVPEGHRCLDNKSMALHQCLEGRAHANRVRACWKRAGTTLSEGESFHMMVIDVDYTIVSRYNNRPTLRVAGVLDASGDQQSFT